MPVSVAMPHAQMDPDQTMVAGAAPLSNCGSAASSAGMISEKKEAVSITPVVKPSDRSRVTG
jgi:hypothetical protein